MPRASRLASVAVLTALLVTQGGAATAQVNIESLRNEIKRKPRFVTFEGGVTGRLGNVQGIVAQASLFTGLHFAKRHLLFLKAQGDYAAFNGSPSVSRSFAHLRYTVSVLPWLSGEAFAQIQQDRFQRLQLRQVTGIGPRFGLLERDDLELFYGTSFMLEYEVLKAETTPPVLPESGPNLALLRATVDAIQGTGQNLPGTLAPRWNNYLSIVYRLSPIARVASVVYVQPRFDDFSDVRVLGDTGVIVELTKALGLKLGVIVRHDTRPARDVKTTDLESKNSLTLSF